MRRNFCSEVLPMKNPTISSSAFVADNATVRGDVTLGECSSVFFGAVLRGDRAPITIGSGTNIQDNCVVHVDYDYPVVVGQNVTVGHGAILHGCTVGDNTLIGMGAIIQEGAVIEENCFIGAGAVVKRGMRIPKGHMAYGIPARIVRPITQAEYDEIRVSTAEYQEYKEEYQRQERENDKLM